MLANDDLPAAVRALLPGLVALGLAARLPVVSTPDGWEIAWAGRCMWGLSGGPLDCAALDLAFRPPGLGLLVGPLSLMMHPMVALGLLALLAMSLCALPLGDLGARLAGGPGRLAAVGLLVLSPELSGWSMAADGRGPALFLTLWAWTLLLRPGPRAVFGAGLAMGLCLLLRPEALAGAALLPLGALLLHRRRGLPSAAGAALGLALSLGLRALVTGRLSASGRLWEGFVLELGALLPLEWCKQLFGLGLWAPPMRAAAQGFGAASGRAAGALDPLTALFFGMGALGGALSLLLWILGALGLVRALGQREGRRVLGVMAGASAAQVAATLLYQARNPALPLSNLLVPLACGLPLVAAGFATLADALPAASRARGRYGLAGLGLLLAAALAVPARLSPGLELSAAGAQAAAAIVDLVADDEPVVASFTNGPLAMRAGRTWVPWPAPWDPLSWPAAGGGRRWALLSSLDGGRPAPLPPGLRLAPVRLYRGPEGWVALAEIRDSTTTP